MMFSPFPKFLRSSPMNLYDLRLPRENTFDIINNLGELSLLHFLDSCPDTPLYSRFYSKNIKRCEDSLLKLLDLQQIMSKFGKNPKKASDISKFLNEFRVFVKSRNKAEHLYMDEVEAEIQETHNQLQAQMHNFEDMTNKRNILHEQKVAMVHAKTFMGKSNLLPQEMSFEDKPTKELKLHYLIGLLMKEDRIRFKRIVFRATKGNALVFVEDLKTEENPIDSKTVLFSLSFFVSFIRKKDEEKRDEFFPFDVPRR